MVVGTAQEVGFTASGLAGDLTQTCPLADLEFVWDFGDGETDDGSIAFHEYAEPGDYTVRLSVSCSSCTAAPAEDTIDIEVIDFTPEVSYRRIDEGEDEALTIAEEDLDGDGEADDLFRMLGGVRQHFRVREGVDLGDDVQEYRWSASGAAGDSRFFDGFATDAMVLTGDGLEGAELTAVYWEANRTNEVDLTVEVEAELANGRSVVGKARMVSRELDQDDQGDDVRMIQHLLRMIGVSESARRGYLGRAVTVDGIFGEGTGRAVRRFGVRDDLPSRCIPGEDETIRAAYRRCIDDAETVVDDEVLEALEEHWTDYRVAQEAYPEDANILASHADFPDWIDSTATVLQNTYTADIHVGVAPLVPYRNLPEAWIDQEARVGHWGTGGVNFRIILGGADELGSIGFTQILNTQKYGTDNIPSIEALNLYHPEENINGVAAFLNDSDAFVEGGGGMHRAFIEPIPANDYEVTTVFPGYPRIGAMYMDDHRDRLTKGVMSYNRGSGLLAFRRVTWPEILKNNDPPGPTTDFGTQTAMRYALDILHEAGFPDAGRVWEWTDQAITTGADDVCDSAATADARDTTFPPAPGGGPGQVCIVSAAREPLHSAEVGNDELREFSFDYQESDWRDGLSWATARQRAIPLRILP